jgi:hypothetical protein
MSALYAIHYQGGAAVGFGAVYIGRGKIVGVDINNVRINGTYVKQGGRMKPNVILTAKNDAVLVTGDQMPAGTTIPLALPILQMGRHSKSWSRVSRCRLPLRRLVTFPSAWVFELCSDFFGDGQTSRAEFGVSSFHEYWDRSRFSPRGCYRIRYCDAASGTFAPRKVKHALALCQRESRVDAGSTSACKHARCSGGRARTRRLGRGGIGDRRLGSWSAGNQAGAVAQGRDR